MIFFERTEKRMITKEMLLEHKGWHSEYLTSINWDDSSGKQEFISGVSKIKVKWHSGDVCKFASNKKPDEIVRAVMEGIADYVDSSEDLATIRNIVEEAVSHYTSQVHKDMIISALLKENKEMDVSVSTGESEEVEDEFASRKICDEIEKRLGYLYDDEYYSLLWDESIRYRVSVMCHGVNRDTGGSVLILHPENAMDYVNQILTRIDVTSGLEMKKEAEEQLSDLSRESKWHSLNFMFYLKMLQFPETGIIVKLKEYLGTMANLLRIKTVLASDFNESPFTRMGMCYYPSKVRERIGTGLVEALQDVGDAFRNNQYYSALWKSEKVFLLQSEIDKITIPEVKELVVEAIHVLNENINILRQYIAFQDAYFRCVICEEHGKEDFKNPWISLHTVNKK